MLDVPGFQQVCLGVVVGVDHHYLGESHSMVLGEYMLSKSREP